MLKKYFLYFILLISLISLSIVLLLYTNHNRKIDEVSTYTENLLSAESKKLTFALNEVRTDLNYLSNKFPTHNQEHIEDDFSHFANQKKRYNQMRFIDNNGMEKIRINFDNKSSTIVSKEKLQNKKDRYYFLKSIGLKKNNIYISPLDLNLEHGSIEVPVKPMLRFSTPVYNDNNEKIGILVLNYLADGILERIRKVRNNFFGELSLLNTNGYYFISKDSSQEWAFMFNNKENSTFKSQFKEAWRKINTKDKGSFEDTKGIYYFNTINFTESIKGVNRIICDDSVWKMVLFVPHSYFEDEIFDDFMGYLPIVFMITIILSIFLWILLINKQRRHKHENKILNLDKQIMNERDIFVAGPTIVFKLKNAYGWPVEYVSENVKNIIGYDADDFLSGNLDYANIILPEYIDKFSESVAIAKMNDEKWFEHEAYKVVCKDGKHIWLSDSVLLIRDENGNVTHLYGYIIDITDLKNAQKKIDDNNRYIKTVIDTIADPTVVIDIKTFEVMLYNKAAKDLYLGDRNMPSSIKCHELSHSNDKPCEGEDDVCPITQILLTKEKTRVTHKHYKENGEVIYVELIAIPILDENNNVIQIIESHRDISHHLETESALKELAATDKLTQTYNRVKFDEILEKSFIVSKETLKYFGLIMFDIDHFKNINDTYGHDVGDSVLIELTGLIKTLIREHDILVRWGGEEFIIYVPDSDNKALGHIAEHLRTSIENYKFKHLDKQITSSFGATILGNNDTIESLIKRLDQALYNSKNNGRNMSTVY